MSAGRQACAREPVFKGLLPLATVLSLPPSAYQCDLKAPLFSPSREIGEGRGLSSILQVFVRNGGNGWENAAGNKGCLGDRVDRNPALNSPSLLPHPSEFSGSPGAYRRATHGRGSPGGEGWLPAILLPSCRVPMGGHARIAEAYSQAPGREERQGVSPLLLLSRERPGATGDVHGPAGSPTASDMSRFHGLCRVCSEQRYRQVGASEVESRCLCVGGAA